MPRPELPPAYHLVAVEREVSAFERAVRTAPRGVDDGTLYWADRTDRLDLAIVLEPETPAAVALQVVYLLALAAGDALGSLLPPVAFGWPNELILAGARVGRIRAAMAPVADPAAPPPWLVLGLGLNVALLGDVTVVPLLETVSRQLLHWTSRWLVEGLEPVRRSWNARCFRIGENASPTLGGEHVAGRIVGLDATGAFGIGDQRFELIDHYRIF